MDTSPDYKKDLLLTVSNDMEKAYTSQNQNYPTESEFSNMPSAYNVNHNQQILPPPYTSLPNEPSMPMMTNFQEPTLNQQNVNPALLIPQYPAMNCCDHMRLRLKLEIDSGSACMCVSCVIIGFVGMILFLAAAIRGASNNNNSRSNYSGGHYHTHWLFIYGGYDPVFIEKRRVMCTDDVDDVQSCFCGCVYPHKFKIFCDDCKQTIKEGTKSGSLASSICFGIFGMILGGVGIYLLTIIR